MKSNNAESKYGWLIMTLSGFTNIAVSLSYMCMPVLFSEISKDLGLSLVELGIIWGIGGLASMIMSPFGGLLGDRYGTKHVITIGCLFLGITGAMRAFSVNFLGLALTMFLFGFVNITLVLNNHKLTGVWFSGKNVVIANGIICTTIGMGQMLSAMISDTIISPLVGGWKNVLFIYAAISAIAGLFWGMTRPEPVHQLESRTIDSPTFKESFSKVLYTKVIWLKSIMHLFFIGSFIGLSGYLSLYLRRIGWPPAAADGALAALNGAGMFAAIPLTILSGRIRSKKRIIFFLLLLDLICIALIPVFDGAMVWVLVILFGLTRDGYFAILITMIMETKGIGARYAGTAIGIVFSFGNLGIFIASTLGNALASINLRLSFIMWALFIAIALLILSFIKEDNLLSEKN